MPLPVGPELKAKIIKLWEADKTRAHASIAKELGCSHSTATYHIKHHQKGDIKNPPHNATTSNVDAQLVRQIKNLTIRGMSAAHIAKELKISPYTIYKLRATQHMEKGHPHAANKISPDTLKALDLRKTGMPIKEIAKILKKTEKATYGLIYYHTRNHKGAENHTHESNSDNNGDAIRNANAPTKAEIIGYCWAEVERGLANLAQRTSLAPDVLRRRISELLGYSTLR